MAEAERRLIREILEWPSDTLKKVSERVAFGPDAQPSREVVELIVKDMVQTMHHAGGVGLAAIQVGFPLRVFVLDLGGGPEVYVNPIWSPWADTKPVPMHEGCLSLKGESALVPRYDRINVIYQDLHGRQRTDKPRGLRAQAIQHECEHLDGKFFLDLALTPEAARTLTPEAAREAILTRTRT